MHRQEKTTKLAADPPTGENSERKNVQEECQGNAEKEVSKAQGSAEKGGGSQGNAENIDVGAENKEATLGENPMIERIEQVSEQEGQMQEEHDDKVVENEQVEEQSEELPAESDENTEGTVGANLILSQHPSEPIYTSLKLVGMLVRAPCWRRRNS